jgi:hypothetical protein
LNDLQFGEASATAQSLRSVRAASAEILTEGGRTLQFRIKYFVWTVVVMVASCACVIAASLPAAAQEFTFDHLKCYPILKDGLRGLTYTADLTPSDPQVSPPEGCRIRVPARYFCTDVDKSNASQVDSGLPPPGAPPGVETGQERLCYRMRCPADKQRQSFAIMDQFGMRQIKLRDRAKLICTPANREGRPTPTPVVVPTPTPAEATPTPEPTAGGSASRAFLTVLDSLF